MSRRIGTVITGGDFQALGVLRSLAKKEIPVVLLDSDHCIGRFSRYKHTFLRSPHPSDRETFVAFLLDLAKTQTYQDWILMPNSDDAVYVLSKFKDILSPHFHVPTPDWDVIQYVYIKEKTYQLAAKHGIPVPHTYYPENEDELLALPLEYPLVIKPSIRDNFYNNVKIKAYRINNRDELIETYRYVCTIIDPSEVLVQEFLPGGPKHLYSLCPFFKDGKIITSITARRARQHPMDFGHATTYAELVDIPHMKVLAEKFLSLIGYYGFAEVEFMQDPRDGSFKLIEVNPRVWGWHTLAIAAGADMPYLLYQDLIGERLDVKEPTDELKWIRLLTDIPTVLKESIRGKYKINDYFKSLRGRKEFAVFSKNDPIPFLAEIALAPYLWMKRGF